MSRPVVNAGILFRGTHDMKTDDAIGADVIEELRWSPDVDDTGITVDVRHGVVTLSGHARSALQKYRAEVAAKRIAGVVGIINELSVRLPPGPSPSDAEIARQAVVALEAHLPSMCRHIDIAVDRGRVSLTGEAEWRYQRDVAENLVRAIAGVTGIDDAISIAPRAAPAQIKRGIEAAFHRSAQIDADAVSVAAEGGNVTLRGSVRSWSEREQAEDIAWCAPGVLSVNNEIDVIHI